MSHGNPSNLPDDPRFRDQIESLARKVQHHQSAEKLWDDLLTEEEKIRLCNGESPATTGEIWSRQLITAYSNGQTLGIWIAARGGDRLRAIIDVGYHLGFLTQPMHEAYLRKCGYLPDSNLEKASSVFETPSWNGANELTFRGLVIRRVRNRGQAVNVATVLDAFQEQSWPARIDDPLPDGRDQQRLHATVRSLNKGLTGIVFSADGSGEGYQWRRVP